MLKEVHSKSSDVVCKAIIFVVDDINNIVSNAISSKKSRLLFQTRLLFQYTDCIYMLQWIFFVR